MCQIASQATISHLLLNSTCIDPSASLFQLAEAAVYLGASKQLVLSARLLANDQMFLTD